MAFALQAFKQEKEIQSLLPLVSEVPLSERPRRGMYL
jgi:hypothetical protein